MTYTNRTSFGQAIRRAIKSGELMRYEKTDGGQRVAVMTDGEVLRYQARWTIEEPRDEAYERAAARDRNDDFSRTGGRDWT